MRLSLTTLTAILLLGPGAGAIPCQEPGLSPPLLALAKRADAANSPTALDTLGASAAAFLDADSPVDAACAHYLLGSAHFARSASGPEALSHAAAAVAHFASAQARTPRAMEAVQPRNRTRTAWARLGAVPGWLAAAVDPIQVVFPPASGERLTLSPAAPEAWAARCPGCVVSFSFPLTDAPTALTVRAGHYRLTRSGPCGTTEVDAALKTGPVILPPPAPCTVRLTVTDGALPMTDFTLKDAQGEPLSALTADAKTVTVEAPGFEPAPVTLAPGQRELAVSLTRCQVQVALTTEPEAERASGLTGAFPWGPHLVTAERAGYAPLHQTLEIPKPTRCAGAHFEQRLALLRPVAVQLKDPQGRRVWASRLVVHGKPESPDRFERAPGRYAFQATHPVFGLLMGTVEVTPCEASCPPAVLEGQFLAAKARPVKAAPWDSGPWPWVTVGLGGVLVAGGMVAGAQASDDQRAIDGYTTRRQEPESLDTYIERRNDRVAAANALVLAGAVTVAAGLLWHFLTEAP